MHWVIEEEKGSAMQKLDHLPSQHGNQVYLSFPDKAENSKQEKKDYLMTL